MTLRSGVVDIDVDVEATCRNTDVQTDDRRSENVEESTTGLASSPIDTDKLNSVTDL